MTTNPPDSADREYTAHDLMRMDEAEARTTLTVAQYERWEGVRELHDRAEERKQQWEDQADTVADVTVAADMEQLGTRVEIYGNDLLVHADPEAPEFRRNIERLESEFGDIDSDDVAEETLDSDRADEYADHLLTMLDLVLVEWGGTEWAALDDGQQQTILQDARSKWGIAGLMRAWADIALAIRDHYEGVVDDLEKFRNPERRGSR